MLADRNFTDSDYDPDDHFYVHIMVRINPNDSGKKREIDPLFIFHLFRVM